MGLNMVLILQLEGTILAPTNAKAWGSGLLQWLEFTKLNGLSIQGSGTINGRGQQWWTYSDPNDDEDDDTVRPDDIVYTILLSYNSKVALLITNLGSYSCSTIRSLRGCHRLNLR
jgi:hypothetical protein